MRLLIAEDDARLLKSLKHIFEANQFAADGVLNGRDALIYAESEEYDGLILDIMMPELDGIEVIKALRKKGISTPALFLTARTEIYQRVEGLNAGADDYLSKPFSADELLARVRAMLRRRNNYMPDLCTFSELTLNRSTYQLEYGNEKATLSGKEFQIMEMLMERPDFIIPIDEFINHVWGWESDVDVSVVWVHISNIRKKLAAMKSKVEINFVRGAGYKLEEVL